MGVTKLWTWTVQNGLLKYGLPSKTMDFTRWRCLSETMDFGTVMFKKTGEGLL
jgi:hypothetical protein